MSDLSAVREEIQSLRQQLRTVQRQLSWFKTIAIGAVTGVLVLVTVPPGLTHPGDSMPTVPDPPSDRREEVPGPGGFLAGTASRGRVQALRPKRLKAPVQVVNASGRVLINLFETTTGGGAIEILDVTGARVAFIGAGNDGSSGVVSAQRRGSGAQSLLFAEADEVGVDISNAAHQQRVSLVNNAFGGALFQFDAGGARVAFVGASSTPGTGIVEAHSSASQARSLLFTDPVKGGQVATDSNVGNRNLQIP